MHPASRRLHSHRRSRALVLVLVMITVATVSVLAAVFFNAQTTTIGIAQNVNYHALARDIAESALRAGITEVRRNANWRTDFTNGPWVVDEPLNGGSFTIAGEDGQDSDHDGVLEGDGDLADSERDFATLTAIGKYDGVTHTVRALLYPPKNALMIVANPASLTAAEITQRDLLISWGWGVTLLKYNATYAQFDAAITDAHVVYFPDSPSLSGAVRDRLNDDTFDVPIVFAHEDLAQELKFTDDEGGSSDYSGTSIDIQQLTQTTTDDLGVTTTEVITHYITEPFPIGPLVITSIADRLLRLDSSVGPGVDKLAARVGDTSRITLGVVDNGGLNYYKKPMRARRVALPWGRRGTFKFSSLNDDGRWILRRSLDWAGSSWTGFLPGVAAWSRIEIFDDAVMDGFDSTVGPYGPTNTNQDVTVFTSSLSKNAIKIYGTLAGNAYIGQDGNIASIIKVYSGGVLTGIKGRLGSNPPIPNPKEPVDMGSSTGDKTYSAGTSIIAGDLHVNQLTLQSNAKVYVVGNTRILCQDQVDIRNGAELLIAGTNFGTNSLGAAVNQFSIAGKQAASQVVLPEKGTVTSIQAYVKGPAGALLRYAIYKDTAGQPGALQLETATQAVTSTEFYWHSIPTASTVLNQGTYWLAVSHEAGITLAREAVSTGQSRHKNHNAVAAGFITPWALSDGTDTQNIYIGANYTSQNGPSVLTIYTKDDCDISDDARLNINTNDPTRLNWLILRRTVRMSDRARCCSAMQAFDGSLELDRDAQFYGTFLGKRVKLEDDSQMHVDTGTSGSVVTLGDGQDLQQIANRFYRWIER